MGEKVVVAMSGGVDSSLTAALLVEQGYEVIGLTMQLSEESRSAGGKSGSSEVSDAAGDARRVADALGIKHAVVDFRELFQRKVISYFLSEYANGKTPNPCIVCNRELKFGALWQKAQEMGAVRIATGHYARILRRGDRFFLRKGADIGKDQSYVLYRVHRDMLPHILMPLGDYTKNEVREMAKRYALPVAHKPESQEICFIPEDDYGAYLKEKRPECLKEGDIVDAEGNVLGRHQGAPLYTIGQRRGLGIAAEHPLYVLKIDMVKNQVIVGRNEAVFAAGLVAADMNWLAPEEPGEALCVMAKIRYGKREEEAVLHPLPEGKCRVDFIAPQRAVTPGQSVVFYEGDIVLGGGIIEKGVL